MLFTSITFAIFLLLVFLLYWFVFDKSLKVQNILLLLSSYVFYGWWDWRFLFLLLFISVSNYLVGLVIQNKEDKKGKKLIFLTGLVINIGTLVVFKYFNFFIDGFVNLVFIIGYKINPLSMNIILPLGISFYVFLSLSYIIDVYQERLQAEKNFLDLLLALSFFPIILAGPIHRPIWLLPQIQKKRIFDYNQATDGLKQILWGVFMKIVIADSCAVIVNSIFANYLSHNGSTLILGIFLFTIQIYADFAGYSNIAIGVGKLLGFNIMQNFNYPYFSKDIKEFWKRWNISLTTWLRDYIFLPIAYSLTRRFKTGKYLFIKTDILIYTISILVTWILSGLWHGANYTFLIWGILQGILLVINHITTKPRRRLLKKFNIQKDNKLLAIFDYLSTFILIMLSWVFFRSVTIGNALLYISRIFSMSIFSLPDISVRSMLIIIIILFFLLVEWIGRTKQYSIENFGIRITKTVRWIIYIVIIMFIIQYSGSEQKFIYFQF